MEPVYLDGTTVSRASLCNLGFLKTKGAVVGSTVSIAKAGDIIPQIQILLFLAFPLVILFWFNNIQRLHDCGQTGYWMLFGFIPIIGGLIYLYLCFMPGNRYPNKYDFVKDGGMTKDL